MRNLFGHRKSVADWSLLINCTKGGGGMRGGGERERDRDGDRGSDFTPAIRKGLLQDKKEKDDKTDRQTNTADIRRNSHIPTQTQT